MTTCPKCGRGMAHGEAIRHLQSHGMSYTEAQSTLARNDGARKTSAGQNALGQWFLIQHARDMLEAIDAADTALGRVADLGGIELSALDGSRRHLQSMRVRVVGDLRVAEDELRKQLEAERAR